MGLNINPTNCKTILIAFTTKRKSCLKTVRIDRQDIDWKNELKYLGLIMNYELSWNKHEIELTNKEKTALIVCRNFAANNQECNPNILLCLYAAIGRPMIIFGAVAWGNKSSLYS